MSVNFFADTDTIVATTTSNNLSTHSIGVASGQEKSISYRSDNSMSNKTVETTALMEKRRYQHHHQGSTGLVGTPDANTYASSMSSDSINNNNQEQQHFASSSSITPQAAAKDCGLDVQVLFSHLHEALALEPKYQPNLFLPQQSNVSRKLLFHFYYLQFVTLRLIWRVSRNEVESFYSANT